jgi:uncharacterized membrane protein YfcA
MNYLVAAIVGLVSGAASGLFGVGGGIVMVPAMVLLLKMDMKIAVATSLVVIIPTSLAGSILNQSFGRIDWRTALALIPMAVVGGLGSTWCKEMISSDMLKRGFGAFLILVGVRLLIWK